MMSKSRVKATVFILILAAIPTVATAAYGGPAPGIAKSKYAGKRKRVQDFTEEKEFPVKRQALPAVSSVLSVDGGTTSGIAKSKYAGKRKRVQDLPEDKEFPVKRQVLPAPSSEALQEVPPAGLAISPSAPLRETEPSKAQSLPECQGADYAFVGGGPIGLYTAVQLKIHHPEGKICVYEKYSTYQRKRKLQVHRQSFDNAAKDKAFQKIIDEFKGYFFNPIKSVETAEIESKLRSFAESIGIQIVNREIKNVHEIKRDSPQVAAIIGSDGAHSMVRKSEFEETQPKVYQYVVEVQYDVKGKPRALGQWQRLQAPFVSHLVREVVSKKREPKPTEANSESVAESKAEGPKRDRTEKSTVTLRMMVNKDEYDALKDKTSFKNPMTVGSDVYQNSAPKELQKTIQEWLNFRKSAAKDEIVQDSVKLLTIPLASYSSSHFYSKKEGDPYIFLVGDAAFGVPFNRSINNGFESGNVLARVLAKLKNKELNPPSVCNPRVTNTYLEGIFAPLMPFMGLKQETPEDYENFMKALGSRESLAAKTKNSFVNAQESVSSIFSNFLETLEAIE